jgi:dipeptidyl aminopeptidase/acylaminoacyl peptidase
LEAQQFAQPIGENGVATPIALDLYRPADSTAALPTIVFVHGGGFTGGSRSEFDSMAAEFAERGYVTVTIDYRLSSLPYIWFDTPSDLAAAAISAAREDTRSAVRWLTAHAESLHVNVNRIALLGYSAGAISAIGASTYVDGDTSVPVAACLTVSISGAALETGSLRGERLFMVHGATDFVLSPKLARDTATQARAEGALVGSVELPDRGHWLLYSDRDLLVSMLAPVLRDELVRTPHCG